MTTAWEELFDAAFAAMNHKETQNGNNSRRLNDRLLTHTNAPRQRSNMSRIAEHYSRARHTGNLKSEPRSRMSASDILGASGMAAQEHEAAMMLWGIVYGGKTSQKLALVDVLAEKVGAHMARNRLKGSPRHIAMEVLAYYLHATCTACGGEGHQIVPGTITRADELCPVCDGLGKQQPPVDEAFTWLHNHVQTLIAIAGGKLMNKIALNMDLK